MRLISSPSRFDAHSADGEDRGIRARAVCFEVEEDVAFCAHGGAARPQVQNNVKNE